MRIPLLFCCAVLSCAAVLGSDDRGFAAMLAGRDRLLEGVNLVGGQEAALAKLKANYDDAVRLEKEKRQTFAEHERGLEVLTTANEEAAKHIKAQPPMPATAAVGKGVPMPPPRDHPRFLTGWHIRRSSEPDNFEKGALAAYEDDGTTEKYSLQAAVLFNFRQLAIGGLPYWSQFGQEFDVTSQKEKNPGKVTTRFTALFLHKPSGADSRSYRGAVIMPTIAHFANRNLASVNVTGGVMVQPVLHFGDFRLNNNGETPWGRYMLGPLVGWEWGSVTKKPAKPQPESGGFTRIVGRMQFRFFPKFTKTWSIYATETVRWLGDDSDRAYYHFNTGLSYKITEAWSLTFDHTIGRDQPTFEMTAATDKIGMELKF